MPLMSPTFMHYYSTAGIDSSAAAIKLAEANAQLNGVAEGVATFTRGDISDFMKARVKVRGGRRSFMQGCRYEVFAQSGWKMRLRAEGSPVEGCVVAMSDIPHKFETNLPCLYRRVCSTTL